MAEVFCGQCGLRLDERSDLPASDRTSCPQCGSHARRFSVTIGDRAGGTDVAPAGVAAGRAGTLDAEMNVQAIRDADYARGTEAERFTISQHCVELVWDAPTAEGSPTMLRAIVGGEVTEIAFQIGDNFGLLMDAADRPEARILPPWDENDD